jgi:hypothetical protein
VKFKLRCCSTGLHRVKGRSGALIDGAEFGRANSSAAYHVSPLSFYEFHANLCIISCLPLQNISVFFSVILAERLN